MKRIPDFAVTTFHCVLYGITLLFLCLPLRSNSQEESVTFTFMHPAVRSVYLDVIYDNGNGRVFLPVTGLFSLLEINYSVNVGNRIISGTFSHDNESYAIDLASHRISLGKEKFALGDQDFRMGESDYYLDPVLFEKVFGLKFTVDVDHLQITLKSKFRLPVEERIDRERARKDPRSTAHDKYPLLYDRKFSFANGAMLDYYIAAGSVNGIQSLNYSFGGGMELLGGDLQGNITGFYDSRGYSHTDISGLRWRLGILQNKFISSFTAGQLTTTGLLPYPIYGAAITNDPIEPRKVCSYYIADGSADPGSEIELYVNGQYAGLQRADELGHYRFRMPLSYGTTRTNLRIFSPSGQSKTIERQLQVPYTFLPPGTVTYSIQAGKPEYIPSDTSIKSFLLHADASVGITRWLTAKIGADHSGSHFSGGANLYYSSVSARIGKQYLFNLDLAPQSFYRLTGSVIYPNDLSLAFIYTKFEGYNRFNTRYADHAYSARIYLPFQVAAVKTSFQLSGEQSVSGSRKITIYSADLTIMPGPVNIRLGYNDNLLTDQGKHTLYGGKLTGSATFTIPQSLKVPGVFRGININGQIQYDLNQRRIQVAELQLARSVFRSGRVDLRGLYNFPAHTFFTQVGLTIDLKHVRSTTRVLYNGHDYTAAQSIYGSVGMDTHKPHVNFSDRQQVGKSGLEVVQFVDDNNSGFHDKGEELLPDNGILLDQPAISEVGRDSILRFSQLLGYYRYNLRVNRDAISDPTLIPLKDEFSFIADPNQYKRIEIPFCHSGTIEGTVYILKNGIEVPQGGLRLMLKGPDGQLRQMVQTFTEGTFYSMDILPGRYTLTVDQAQMNFLGVMQKDTLRVEIKATAAGDFHEGLRILLVPGEPSGKASGTDSLNLPEMGHRNEGSDTTGFIPDTPTKQDTPGKEISRPEPFMIQVGTFDILQRAQSLQETVSKTYNRNVKIFSDKGMYSVRIIDLPSFDEASRLLRILKQSGFIDTLILEEEKK
ncbi:MAG TPA: SPOR domain-containing protein [Bacteroidales bacterium]|nr:SPOR domain-containing protein [Bacteroidales bacterium]